MKLQTECRKIKMRRVIIRFIFGTAAIITSAQAYAETPLDILGVEKNINDLAQRAQQTGDAIARAFAEQALRIIAEWKKANADLINTAFDKLDKQTREVFTNINNVATRLEKGEAVAFIDLQRTMATMATVASQLPLASKEPQVLFYWPSILVPSDSTGVNPVNVRILGTRIADANPQLSIGDKPIELKRYSDNEIGFYIAPSMLEKAKASPKTTSFKLKYASQFSVWYKPASWHPDVKQRDIDLTMLPSVPGSVTLTQTATQTQWETSSLGPYHVSGKGQDSVYQTGYALSPAERQAGWEVDIDRQGGQPFNDNGGDGNGGSSCTGYDPQRITPLTVGFNIQLGHTRRNLRNDDAYQNCNIWIAVKRQISSTVAQPTVTKELSWVADTDFDFVPNAVSKNLTMTLYNGASYTINSAQQVPYSLFDVMFSANQAKFRPRSVRGF